MTRSPSPRGLRRPRARTGGLVLVGTVLIGGTLTSAAVGDTHNPEPYPDAERHAPSAMPDRIILTPTEDTATSQTVSWRTDGETHTAQAQLSPMASGPQFDDSAESVLAQSSEPMMADLGFPVKFHTATFTGLDPDTEYLYRVGDGVNWSAWMEFETASAGAEPFSFIYYGDAQNMVHEHVSRVFRKAFTERPEADLILHAGDVCVPSVLDELASFAPLVVVRGNNDGPDVATWGAPDEVQLDVAGLAVAMVHDSGAKQGRGRRLRRRFPEAALVVFGHSHIPVDVVEDGLHLVNPGSPTDRRRQPHGTIGLLDIDGGHLRRSRIIPVT